MVISPISVDYDEQRECHRVFLQKRKFLSYYKSYTIDSVKLDLPCHNTLLKLIETDRDLSPKKFLQEIAR